VAGRVEIFPQSTEVTMMERGVYGVVTDHIPVGTPLQVLLGRSDPGTLVQLADPTYVVWQCGAR
jgi:hypothetical protein